MSEIVTMGLTSPQVRMVTGVATERRVFARENRLKPKYGGDNNWEDDIHACCVEFAVAMYCNLFWDGSVGILDEPDVGGMIEVKSIRMRDRRLMLHPRCKDHVPFVCGFADLDTVPDHALVELHGWMLGRDGKRQECWRDPTGKGRPAFFVPRPYRPMEELRDWVALQPPLWCATKREAAE